MALSGLPCFASALMALTTASGVHLVAAGEPPPAASTAAFQPPKCWRAARASAVWSRANSRSLCPKSSWIRDKTQAADISRRWSSS